MLFGSVVFVFVFLPISLIAFHVSRVYFGGKTAMAVAASFSLFFYGWWNPIYLPLILISIVFNYFSVVVLSSKRSWAICSASIAVNLLVLGYFKYKNFFLENIEVVSGVSFSMTDIIIPLGISFFTFQQIAVIVDANDGSFDKAPSFLEYAVFVLFFPQLIAGPIVLYQELSKQYTKLQQGLGSGFDYFGRGLLVFSLGLLKKNALADPIGQDVDQIYSMIGHLTMLEAWYGAMAFMVQVYLDFSGYADMAVGLGLMFGLLLPANFHQPYRATSLIEFWKRWHITMTRFFTMYFYTPLALAFARSERVMRMPGALQFVFISSIPLLLTFLISGLWHGAAWTFVAFGGVNGLGLVVNHVWKEWRLPKLPGVVGWALTMLTFMVSLVYFRAPDMAGAHQMLSLMFDPSAFALPTWLANVGGALSLPVQGMTFFTFGTTSLSSLLLLLGGVAFSMLAPDLTHEHKALPLTWGAAVLTACLFLIGAAFADQTATFVYFQF